MAYKRKRSLRIEWVADVARKDPRGKIHRFTKVFSRKMDAQEWEISLRKMPTEELFPAMSGIIDTASLTLLEWSNEYLDEVQVRYIRKTYNEKRKAFEVLFMEVDPYTRVADLTKRQVTKSLMRRAEEKSGHAANVARKNLIAAWNWGIENIEGFPSNNVCKIKRFAEVRHPRRVPDEAEFWRVFYEAEYSDKVQLLTILHLAARRNEVWRLRLRDLDFRRGRVRLYTRKTKDGSEEFAWLPMTEVLKVTLWDWVQRQNITEQDALIFPCPKTGREYTHRNRLMHGLCERAEIEYFGFHAIRHLSASLLGDANVPIRTIQQILRHKNITTTERYVHTLTSAKDGLEILAARSMSGYSQPSATTYLGFKEKRNQGFCLSA